MSDRNTQPFIEDIRRHSWRSRATSRTSRSPTCSVCSHRARRPGPCTSSARGAEGRVCFKDGRVFFASSAGHRDTLGKRLATCGRHLREAAAPGARPEEDPEEGEGRTAGSGRYSSTRATSRQKVLENFIQDQITRHAVRPVPLGGGRAALRGRRGLRGRGHRHLASPSSTSSPTRTKRLEMWNRIREKIPSMDTALRDGRRARRASPIEIHLKPREWMLLCYLHGGPQRARARRAHRLQRLRDREDPLRHVLAAGLIEKVGSADERRLAAVSTMTPAGSPLSKDLTRRGVPAASATGSTSTPASTSRTQKARLAADLARHARDAARLHATATSTSRCSRATRTSSRS